MPREPVSAARRKAAAVATGAGRVGGRDPDPTRSVILAAATDEFATHGLGGARVDRIAERAGINKRMLYYYFGHKDDLFLVVLEESYRRIREAEVELNLTRTDPVEGIRRLVTFTWNYYREHPEFIRLLNSENMHRAEHLKRSRHIRAMHSPLVATIEDLLERGRRTGVFRAGVDPVQLYVSIAGLAYFYLSNQHTLSTIFGRDLDAPRELAERLSHMIDVVLGYLIRG
ncbi:MAG: TetR family transcriptional regulator [Burkholderiales bacterium]|nr:MAG: TetR family transcriptional regulator [Burkholderiales bacterium]